MIELRDRVVTVRANGSQRDILLREYQPHIVQSWVALAFFAGVLIGLLPFGALITQLMRVCQ